MPKVLLRSEESGGEVSLVDNVVPAGFPGPPLHTHDFDEAFLVLEGELTFQVEDQLVTKAAGELAFAARNVPHTFANLSGEPARYVLVCTPAGFERYFARMAAEKAGVEPPSGRSRAGRRSPRSVPGSGSDHPVRIQTWNDPWVLWPSWAVSEPAGAQRGADHGAGDGHGGVYHEQLAVDPRNRLGGGRRLNFERSPPPG